jgi:polar amino acid transport system substrate-binding protein
MECATLTVGVENQYPPFNYIPEGATEGAGWDYDMWRAMCDLMNCVPEFVESAWPAVLDQVAQGDLDTAADGISITDERKEILAFSDAYMTVQQKFLVRLDEDRYATADDVIASDALVGTQVGTTNFDLAVELVGEERISAFDTFPLAIQALIGGDVDVVIIDDQAGYGYIGVNKEQLKAIDDALFSDPLGFIFPLDSELVGPVNQAVQELKENGTFEEIFNKFFGPDWSNEVT